MTVPTEVSEINFTGNGVATAFPIPFPIKSDGDLIVTLLPPGGTLAVTQVLDASYIVTGEGGDTCTVTMAVPPVAGAVLHVERTVPIIQQTNFRTAGPFAAETHTATHDWGRYIDQQLERRIAAVEALGSLVPTSSYTGILRTKQFTTDAADVENTWPLTLTVPAGFIPTGVAVVKVVAVAAPNTPIRQAVFAHWAVGTSIPIGPSAFATLYHVNLLNISGLEPGTEYLITFKVLSEPVT